MSNLTSDTKSLTQEAIRIERAEIVAELEVRKRKNPLLFFENLPIQKLFGECIAKIKGLFGGNRCIGGETLIYDPVKKKYERVDSINNGHHVYAWDGAKIVIATAGRPFKKDVGRLFTVVLSSGESFVCAETHLLLSPCGFLPLSELSVGSQLCLPQTNLGYVPKAHVSGGRNFWQTIQGFQYGYRSLFCFCDVQFRSLLNIALNVFPLRSCVQGHISNEVFLRKDGQHSKLGYNQTYQQAVRPSIQGVRHQILAQFFDILYRAFYKLCKLVLNLLEVVHQSMLVFFLHLRSKFGFVRLDNCCDYTKACDFSFVVPVNSVIISSIKYLRDDVKWDFEVPRYRNYVCGGVVHHNSGKTEKGAEYVLQKCLAKPKQRWWCAAESFSDSVNIQQRKIWSLVPKNEVRYGRYDEVNGFTNRKLILKNKSIIIFKSYDQKREGFQGEDLDGVWNDEEPPYDIYREERMRLMDRDGEMIFTMTSMKGITELVEEIFEDHDVIESQYAPLVNETLPRIVEKNGARFFLLWTPENKHIDQDRVLFEAKLTPLIERKSRFYGIPANLSGKIYPSFNKRIHVIRYDDLPPGPYTLYMTLDPHDRKPWAMSWDVAHITGTVYTVDEYPNRNFNEMLTDDKTYDDYAAVIKAKERVICDLFGTAVHKRILDPNFGNKTVQLAERQGGQSKTTPKKELEKRGFVFVDGIDAIEAGHLKVREYLHYETKGTEIVAQPKWFICDHCQNTITHHSRYSRKDVETADGDIKDKVKPMDKYKDFCDLKRYLFMSNPRYIVPQPFRAQTEKVY